MNEIFAHENLLSRYENEREATTVTISIKIRCMHLLLELMYRSSLHNTKTISVQLCEKPTYMYQGSGWAGPMQFLGGRPWARSFGPWFNSNQK